MHAYHLTILLTAFLIHYSIAAYVALHPVEEIHVSELLHLVHVHGLDDLFVVEEYPAYCSFVNNVLSYEGHIVSDANR